MKIVDENAYYVLTSDKNKKKILQEAFKSGDKVYHGKYGTGEFVRFDEAYFYMAHVNFESGEHVVTALDLEWVEDGQTQPIKAVKPDTSLVIKARAQDTEAVMISTDEIVYTGWNPRGDEAYQGEKFEELKESMRAHGFWKHKALLVRPHDSYYQLIAGHRRLHAAIEVGITEVPAVIREMNDWDAEELLYIDNLHAEDFAPLEHAVYLKKLLEGGRTQEELAKKIGKSQGWIARTVGLLRAPEEVKELIITRRITPKHTFALQKYQDYPVLKESILPKLRAELDRGGEVSVSKLDGMISNTIEYDWNADQVLRLHDFPSRFYELRKYFDFSNCKGCKDLYIPEPEEAEGDVEPPDEKNEKLFCLNRRCWSDKVEIAKQKLEKARSKKTEKLAAGEEIVDTHALKWNEYKTLQGRDWDQTECETCSNRKKDKHNNRQLICIGPACFDQKENAYQREKNKIARGEAERAFDAMDTWIDTLSLESHEISKILSNKEFTAIAIPTANARGLIKILVRHLWGESIKKALKPWTPKGGKWNVDEVDKIPDDDVLKALLRLVFVQDLTAHNYQGVNIKAVEKVIAVFEGKPLPKKE